MVVPLKRLIGALLVLLGTFCAIFFASLRALDSQTTLFGLGLPYEVENALVMVLSVVGIVFVVYEILTIERNRVRIHKR